MIDFSEDTYQALLQKMLAQIPDTYDKRDGSPIPTALGPVAFVLAGFYLSLNQVQKQAFVQTAVGQPLDYLATLAGLTRYPASAAVRLGVFNTAVPVGARFSTINGADSINFVVTAPAEGANAVPADRRNAGKHWQRLFWADPSNHQHSRPDISTNHRYSGAW